MLLAHAPTHPTPELGGSPNPKQRSKISSARAGDDHEKEAAARELPRPQAPGLCFSSQLQRQRQQKHQQEEDVVGVQRR